jgi:1D-myo-inositol-tetrakisphosphate 5-kinase/inositol-polyphosphate multikinase
MLFLAIFFRCLFVNNKNKKKRKKERSDSMGCSTSRPSGAKKVEVKAKESPSSVSTPKSDLNFVHQTGGHEGSFKKQELDKLMKPVSEKELHFYVDILEKVPSVAEFVPPFFGTSRIDDKNYVVLADLTHGFKKPSIMDVKMGTTSVGEDANPEKKAAMEAKDKGSTTATLGIRIVGQRTYQITTGTYDTTDKRWGQNVKTEDFLASLSRFFNNGREMRWFEHQHDLRFYSSSLLFLYEGDVTAEPRFEIRMIDFAHVHEIKDGGRDEGYLVALKNLIKFLKQI